MSKEKRFVNGITEKKVASLPNTSSFEGCVTKAAPSQCLISEAVRLRINSKKNILDAHYVEGVITLNLKNGNVLLFDEDGNMKVRTNMFDIKTDMAEAMKEIRNAIHKNDNETGEMAFIKCLLLKHIYTHYAALYTHISPDVCDKIK